MNKHKCIKQEVIAIIKNKNKFWVGSNWCKNYQKECPRKGMKSGTGYHLCREICEQQNHAEVDACINAGIDALGGVLHLIGHTYCCDDCKKVMKKYGIKEVIIGKYPKGFKK